MKVVGMRTGRGYVRLATRAGRPSTSSAVLRLRRAHVPPTTGPSFSLAFSSSSSSMMMYSRGSGGTGRCCALGNNDVGEGIVDAVRELWTLAEAASIEAVSSGQAETVTEVAKKKSDWISPLSNALESILKVLDSALEAVHVPYSYGFAIILLTIFVKLLTFPLTKQTLENSNDMQKLQPRIAELKALYPNDQERLQMETAKLYQTAGINPLAGCLPTLATIPIFLGLYRGLTQAADDGLLADGFFFIPSLSGPTSIAERTAGAGLQWLLPLKDGAPPIGWHDAGCYLILPALIVGSQFVSLAVTSAGNPAAQEQQKSPVFKFLPFLLGYFSLNVPSGLTLYWLTNNILSTVQTVVIRSGMDTASPATISGDSTAAVNASAAVVDVSPSVPVKERAGAAVTQRVDPMKDLPPPPSAVMGEFASGLDAQGSKGSGDAENQSARSKSKRRRSKRNRGGTRSR